MVADSVLKMIDIENLIDIISCVFTVGALVFTLYFWLLDHLNEEESEFIKNKYDVLKVLKKSYNTIKYPDCVLINGEADCTVLLRAIYDASKQMEIILSYRFWARSKYKDTYLRVNNFYRDSKYTISTIRRSIEKDVSFTDEKSLVYIGNLSLDEIEDIRSDYEMGLSYTIEFIENWE